MILTQAKIRQPAERSWLGVCSWAMAIMAVSLILGWTVCFPNEVNKLQGFEFIILGPLSWFIHLLGLGFGVAGWKRRLENPFAVSGTIVNLVFLLLPLLGFLLRKS